MLTSDYLKSYPVEKYFSRFFKQDAVALPSLASLGFYQSGKSFPSGQLRADLLMHYKERRDFPSTEGTSRLSVHLRFGSLSLRELVVQAQMHSETFLNELIWRDFYQMILWHFPQVGMGKSFKSEYDLISWRKNEIEFQHWCDGQTGYPLVDAGMRQLNATGFMHNRLRMVTASFLTKHLLIDWRWGEAYFAKKLLDFDLASNNGGWQWATGCGCDAAPYFRIFNPSLQTKKFDPELKFIRTWVPEFEEFTYPRPIVDHDFARKRALDAYAKALRPKISR
jgi:deoxyribodipyrimidine photo-lyase